MIKFFAAVLTLAGFSLFLSNCASLTGFQDGRSVGKGNGEISGSLNVSQSPDFKKLTDGNDSVKIPNLFAPSLEFGGRYGVGEKVDLMLRLNTNLNLGFGAKFQLVGDRETPFAMAIGGEVGTFGLITGLWNVQIPVYLSLYPTEKVGIYITPRYIYQFSSFVGTGTGLTYLGGNTGVLLGKRNKFGIDLGYYRLSAKNQSIGLVQVGIGGRFLIGDH